MKPARKHKKIYKEKLAQSFNQSYPSPPARKDNTVKDVFHGHEVADPYRHLERLDAFETSVWVKAQNHRFSHFIKDVEGQDAMAEAFMQDWDYEREGLVDQYGAYFFSHYHDGKTNQGVYRVRDDRAGEPRTLIDPNTLSTDGTVALSGVFPSPDGKFVAYLTSVAGSDAQTLRIRQTETGEDLPDVIEECRFTGVTWDKDGTGFNYTYPAHDDLMRSLVKHHTLGQSVQEDSVVFEIKDVANSSAHVGRLRDERFGDSGYEYAMTWVGTSASNGFYIKKPGKDQDYELVLDDAKTSVRPIAMVEGKLYVQTDLGAPQGRIAAIDLNSPAPENWDTVLMAEGGDKLEQAMVHQGQLTVHYLHDAASKISFYDLKGAHKHDMPLPEQTMASMGKVNKEDTHYQISVSGFTTPGTQYKYDIEQNQLTVTKDSAAKVDTSDFVVERLHATSKDGTKVPMTVIRRKDVKLDGTAATKLYGYGGFNVPLTPGFSLNTYNWVKEGGVFVQANLRGGGEFGAEWYDQGRLLNKQNVFDDFAACAEHLIKNKYTSPERLSIDGGSNGGLLTLATALQRPELFGAVLSRVAVVDMYRFHKATYGAAWKSDYGDVEGNKAHFNAASAYSPLHNVKGNVDYPPTLLLTGDHDDRVVPSHSYKFIATTAEHANDNSLFLMRVEKDAGHGAGKPRDKIIREAVEAHAFLVKSLGPIDQNAYKAFVKKQKKKGLRNPFGSKPK